MRQCDRSYYFGSAEEKIFVQEWGGLDKPVFLLVHGFPGCSEHGRLVSTSPLSDSFRLVAIDRPGYGESKYQKDLTFLKFASQIKKLLDEQRVDKFSIISVSGGAPYALAVAYLMKDQVLKLTSLGGIAPITFKNFKYMNRVQKKTWLANHIIPESILHFTVKRVWEKGLSKIEETLFTEMDAFSEPDKKVFMLPEIQSVLVEATHLAVKQGPEGVLHDIKMFARNWGFPLSEITCPVTLWHGSADDVVHFRFAQDMKVHLQKATLNFVENEGHYSILLNCRDQILSDLLPAS
jgi:pimeloyl-ACP methyl ester carboxylesterase